MLNVEHLPAESFTTYSQFWNNISVVKHIYVWNSWSHSISNNIVVVKEYFSEYSDSAFKVEDTIVSRR